MNNQLFGMGTFEIVPRMAVAITSKYGDISTMSPESRQATKYKMATDLTDDKLDEIAHHLKEVIEDDNAQIMFEPSEKEADAFKIMELQIFGERSVRMLRKRWRAG